MPYDTEHDEDDDGGCGNVAPLIHAGMELVVQAQTVMARKLVAESAANARPGIVLAIWLSG